MNSTRKSKRIKCPICGGNGVIFEITEKGKDVYWIQKGKSEYNEEQRLPNLTGTKMQCDEALVIRSRYVHQAKMQYQEESFKTFIKLISYEAHSIFWLANKECSIGSLLGKIAVKNPTAFDLIDSIGN
jgi:hypothetical protein